MVKYKNIKTSWTTTGRQQNLVNCTDNSFYFEVEKITIQKRTMLLGLIMKNKNQNESFKMSEG